MNSIKEEFNWQKIKGGKDMKADFIQGLDGKLYGIIDGEVSEVIQISREDYDKLSDEEQSNGKIYVLID